jgi:fumarate reductase subunit C
MSANGKPYVREVSRYGWFLRNPRYRRYMAREVTCVFIGLHALILLVALKRLSEGREAWEAFLHNLTGPAGVVLQLIILAFAVYHSTSWFNVTPKAMPVQIGEQFLPGAVIIGAHYAAWLIVTVTVLFLAGAF